MHRPLWRLFRTLGEQTFVGVAFHVGVEFHIGKDGQLLSLELIASSGEAVLDTSAMNAVKLAEHYPPLPEAMRREVLPVVAIFTYRIRTTQSSTFQHLQ